jgi:hypothetical protein
MVDPVAFKFVSESVPAMVVVMPVAPIVIAEVTTFPISTTPDRPVPLPKPPVNRRSPPFELVAEELEPEMVSRPTPLYGAPRTNASPLGAETCKYVVFAVSVVAEDARVSTESVP